MAALYLNHPYGRPVIGWRQEIEKLDREDALAFYKRFYAPNNAIAGDRRRRRRQGDPPDGGADLRRDPGAARHSGAARPAAGAGAGSAAHRDAVRSARRAAQRAALLSRALRHHRRGGRKPGARRARAIDGQRRQLLSLPRAGDRPAARGQRRRRLSGHLARCRRSSSISASPKPGVEFSQSRAGDRRA